MLVLQPLLKCGDTLMPVHSSLLKGLARISWGALMTGSRQLSTTGTSCHGCQQSASCHQASHCHHGAAVQQQQDMVMHSCGSDGLMHGLIRGFSTSSHASSPDAKDNKHSWQALASQMPEKLNPCNSPLHPAVIEGVITSAGVETCVQEAYTPQSTCFGCGPASVDGLKLKSYRIKNGLEAHVSIPAKFCAFPGIVNGGIVSALLDCHGNWTAAIALMDKGCLPKPPLTLTHSMYVTYKEPTPPDTELLVRSQVLAIKESSQPGVGKASVEVESCVYLREGPPSPPDSTASGSASPAEPKGLRLLVTAVCLHKRLGALRAL